MHPKDKKGTGKPQTSNNERGRSRPNDAVLTGGDGPAGEEPQADVKVVRPWGGESTSKYLRVEMPKRAYEYLTKRDQDNKQKAAYGLVICPIELVRDMQETC